MSLTALVLAGGASRRMGRDKLLLAASHQAHESVLAHVVRTAAAITDDVWVVASPNADEGRYPLPSLDRPVQWIRDEIAHQGPLQALARVWPKLPDDRDVLVLAGDLPGLSVRVLERCTDVWRDCVHSRVEPGEPLKEPPQEPFADAVLVSREGRLQPLLGIYRYGVAKSVFCGQAAAGQKRLQPAMEGMRIAVIEAEQENWPVWWTKPIHTPEDYEAWLNAAEVLARET